MQPAPHPTSTASLVTVHGALVCILRLVEGPSSKGISIKTQIGDEGLGDCASLQELSTIASLVSSGIIFKLFELRDLLRITLTLSILEGRSFASSVDWYDVEIALELND